MIILCIYILSSLHRLNFILIHHYLITLHPISGQNIETNSQRRSGNNIIYIHVQHLKKYEVVEVIRTQVGSLEFVYQQQRQIIGCHLRPIIYLPIPCLPIQTVCLRPSVVCFLTRQEGEFFHPQYVYLGGEGFNTPSQVIR